MNTTAANIKPGMVIDTTQGRIHVAEAVTKWGAVQVFDGIKWRGLGLAETVTVAGHYNP